MPEQPVTPAGRHATSSRRSSQRTSAATPSNSYFGGIVAPATPHALRALQRRAAAYTPGRDRRKSQRFIRETPMDILRNLGRALAPTTNPISSSPEEKLPEPSPPSPDELDELDHEPPIPRPRLSLPMNEMVVQEDDGSPPPRMSILPFDEDITQRSIELPRRERSMRDRVTLSRVSFGSNRFSDYYGDTTNIDPEDALELAVAQDDDGIDDQLDHTTGQPIFDAGGETEDLRRFNLEFAFPTPERPPVTETIIDIENDDFVLETIPQDFGPGVPTSDSDIGAVGFESATPELPSTKRTFEEEKTPEPRKIQKVSKHGVPVPRIPSGVVKKLAMRFAKTGGKNKARINKDTLAAIEQATDWFFEQASEDLSTYSKHSGRKTIDESDVVALMTRQRHVGKGSSVFALAHKYLPKELLQDIRLPKK
ncbi:hypothetical protein FQN57_004868 [Myotisia sp. PD_48]|nr:hypothetical protein FQN57_004868 [Myotisia sp. PD_48]